MEELGFKFKKVASTTSTNWDPDPVTLEDLERAVEELKEKIREDIKSQLAKSLWTLIAPNHDRFLEEERRRRVIDLVPWSYGVVRPSPGVFMPSIGDQIPDMIDRIIEDVNRPPVTEIS